MAEDSGALHYLQGPYHSYSHHTQTTRSAVLHDAYPRDVKHSLHPTTFKKPRAKPASFRSIVLPTCVPHNFHDPFERIRGLLHWFLRQILKLKDISVSIEGLSTERITTRALPTSQREDTRLRHVRLGGLKTYVVCRTVSVWIADNESKDKRRLEVFVGVEDVRSCFVVWDYWMCLTKGLKYSCWFLTFICRFY